MRSRTLRALGLATLVLAVFLPPLLRGETIVGRDLLAYFYPRFEAAGAVFAQGDVPRWNPWSANGAGWFGPRAGGVLYPGNLLFAWLQPATAMAWFLLLHALLALYGMQRLVARDTPGVPAAAAGIAYGLGGFLISLYGNPPYLVSGAWLPWAVLGGLGLRDQAHTGKGVLLLGGSSALCILAGEPQGALLGASLGGLAAVTAREGRRLPALGWAVLAIGLSAAAAGVQVLSIWDETPRTDRALAAFAGDDRWGLAGGALLLQLIAPGVLGETAQGAGGYWGFPLWGGQIPWCGISVGLVGLAAAISGSLERRPARRVALALIVLGLVLTGVRAGATVGLRFPAKWLVLVAFGLAWAVGLGFARWDRGRGRGALLTVSAFALVFGGIGALGLTLAAEGVEGWFAGLEPGRIDGGAARLAARDALLRTAILGGALLGVWAAASHAQRLPWGRARVLLLGLLAFDLLGAGQQALETTRVPLLETPPLASTLHAAASGPTGAPVRYEAQPFRILKTQYLVAREGVDRSEGRDLFLHQHLQTDECYREGVRAIRPFEAVRERARAELVQDPRFAALPQPIRLALLDAELFLMTRAEALRASRGAERALLQPLGAVSPGVFLMRNLACPPYAYLVARAHAAGTREEARQALLDVRRAPLDVVVLGPDAQGPELVEAPAAPLPGRGSVEVASFAAERIVLRVATPSERWLVVRESFHPDWRAELDGRPVGVLRADLLYRAVLVPAGNHEVVFRYDPWWWGPGVRLMACGWLLLLGALFLPVRRGEAIGSGP